MRIFVPVHHFTDDPTSGIETGLWNFPLQLAEAGHEVHVFTLSSKLVHHTKAELRKKGIRLYQILQYKTHGLDKTVSFLSWVGYALLRLKYRYDWVFIIDAGLTHFGRFPLGAKVAARVLVSQDPATQAFFQTGDWLFDRQRKDEAEGWRTQTPPFFFRVCRFLAEQIWYRYLPVHEVGEKSDILFCEGSSTYAYYRALYPTRAAYLPLGVENYRFDTTPHTSAEAQKKFAFLFVGRIQRMKGIYYLIEAFRRLAAIYPAIELWVVGRHHGIYSDLLAQHLDGLEDRVRVLGEADRSTVIRYLRACQVVVDPMIWANYSTIALEALYCEKPLIGARNGNTKDFVRDGETGFLVDARDVSELSSVMEHVYTHYPEAVEGAKKGSQFVKDHLTWKKVGHLVEKHFLLFDDKRAWQELTDAINKTYIPG